MYRSIARSITKNDLTIKRLISIQIEKTTSPTELPKGKLGFGHHFSDHMIEADFHLKTGWGDIKIKPFQDLKLHPASTCLHYGLECFEGLKAYRDKEGNIRMFRPLDNMERMNLSMKRLCLPSFPKTLFLDAIKKCIKIDEKFVPSERGTSLYIRPTAIATCDELGVHESSMCKWFCIFSPVGSYYPSGMKPISLFATNEFARSCPGGIGYTKAGGNYAPTIYPALLAGQKGCEQILWLYNDYVTEGGAMNCMFVIKGDNNKKELWTSPLNGLILPGITRDSVLKLANHWGSVDVKEKDFTIHDLMAMVKENRVLEGFCTGTAAVLTPIKSFKYEDKEYVFNSRDSIGELTQQFYDSLLGIQYGDKPNPFPNDPWSVVI